MSGLYEIRNMKRNILQATRKKYEKESFYNHRVTRGDQHNHASCRASPAGAYKGEIKGYGELVHVEHAAGTACACDVQREQQ